MSRLCTERTRRRGHGRGRSIAIRAVTAALLASVIASVTPAASDAVGPWVCPPCECPNDGRGYPRAGRCEACGMSLIRSDESRNVAILLFEGVQIIDYTGPYEVFGQVGPFNVYTVSRDGKTLSTAMEMSVNPTYSFDNAPEPDILVVPGGAAHVAYDDPKVVAWVREKAETAEHVMSVCNGAFILAKAGLLDGKQATTFYGLIDDLRAFAPRTEVVTDQRFVDNGKVITSAGLSSGIDASLHLVSKIRGEARARHLALHLEYDWNPESDFARAALADMQLPSIDPPPGAATSLLATAGDRERWERQYRIASSLTLAELRDHIVSEVESLDGWSRVEDTATVENSGLTWSRQADGATWLSRISVETDPRGGAQLVTMQVERTTPQRSTRRH